jgi:hypothetical protein
MRLTPPIRRPPADALDSELYDMAKAEERGFVRFPPPPPPVDLATALARREPCAITKTQADDTFSIWVGVWKIMLCLVLAIPVLSAWYIWTH